MTADDPADQSFMSKVIQPFVFAVADAGGIDNGEVFGFSLRDKLFFDGPGDAFGKADADKSAERERVSVANDAHRLIKRNYLAALHAPGQVAGDRMTALDRMIHHSLGVCGGNFYSR